MGGRLKVRAGAQGPRRAADGSRPSCVPSPWRGPSTPMGHTAAQAALPSGARQEPGLGLWAVLSASTPRGLMWPSRRGQPRTCRGQGPGAPESLAPLLLPSRTPTPLSLPPHLTQANTSKSNVLLSNSAKVHSRRPLLHPLLPGRCLLPALASSAPAWGTRNGRSLAPGAKTPWNLVRFARGGGTRDATRRNSSSPVKSRCVVPSGSGRFMR